MSAKGRFKAQERPRVLNSDTFLHSVLDHLNVGLVVVDADGRIALFNRLAGEMLHEDPAERCGSTILSCHPSESEGKVEKLMGDLRTGALDHYEGWVNYRGRMLYEYILPVHGPQGEYLGMIEELHDAADDVEMMRRLGERKGVHVSGVGARAPRPAEFGE
jgi:PAS domain S-box-containing protein